MGFGSRVSKAFNVFMDREEPNAAPDYEDDSYGYSSHSINPDRAQLNMGGHETIAAAIFNRIALDCASIDILHVKLDEKGRYSSDIMSELNDCLNLEANIDQSGSAFRHDMFLSLLDEGSVALVPIDVDRDPDNNGVESLKIYTMRVGKITEWFPRHVRIEIYNDRTGEHQEIVMPKKHVAIIENPLGPIMNEPNSTMQRLIRKLALLDIIDNQSGSGKLDLIVQLPYTVKTTAKEEQAEKRRKAIETQLTDSKYGIAYIDSTEHVTQLNRPVENNLMKQIEYLTSMLYSQLGITQSIMDGSADDSTMVNYYSRTIEPLLSAAVNEIKRKFLTKTARTQKQSIKFFRNPFKLVPVNTLAEMADKLTRNEIMSSNEIRQEIGLKPSADPKADELRNKNLSEPKEEVESEEVKILKKEEDQNGKNREKTKV